MQHATLNSYIAGDTSVVLLSAVTGRIRFADNGTQVEVERLRKGLSPDSLVKLDGRTYLTDRRNLGSVRPA